MSKTRTSKRTALKALQCSLAAALLSASSLTFAGDGWTEKPYAITMIDSWAGENTAYLTLENYSNDACSLNRINISGMSEAKFNQLFSMVLSAFHSGSKVRFYFPDISTCRAARIEISK